MRSLTTLIRFYHYIHPYKIPKLKFKEMDNRYKILLKKEYNIDENDINKSNFIIFVIIFSIFLFSLTFFTKFNILINVSSSFLLALIGSYFFSQYLYKEIKKEENQLNALLYIVKIYFTLIQKSYGDKADHAINFIKLISEFKLPISEDFRNLLSKIQLGENPEILLSKVTTPSSDFNLYIKRLLLSNFSYDNTFDDNSLEKKFRKYLREIESKLSILFFFGLFFPLGLCLLILFHRMNYLILVSTLPLFFISIRTLNKKFLKKNFFLLGLINNYSREEKAKFKEFISFLLSFTLNLKQYTSPEIAFVKAYSNNQIQYSILEKPLKSQIYLLLNFSCTFKEILENLQNSLTSIRYKIILDVIEKLVAKNAYLSHEKISEIINELSFHQQLESRLDIIIKGEKFKVLLFLFLLPIITGGIGGLFPLFNFILGNFSLHSAINFSIFFELLLTYDFIITFLSLLFCVNISSHYFLEIISIERKRILTAVSNAIFILAFFSTFISIINFF
ncbi:MAG: hypothetical protein EAX91_10960 [Candidatus Lokiarchaeota archaeon]|nr:hypothetical protein [Candidatus Lokiarchaeota archaeon]